jgi:hypothetical protein
MVEGIPTVGRLPRGVIEIGALGKYPARVTISNPTTPIGAGKPFSDNPWRHAIPHFTRILLPKYYYGLWRIMLTVGN